MDHSTNATMLDLYSLFHGHGFNGNDNWFYSDCIHPNTKGYEQLRRAFWHMISGETMN